ncbi:MAG: glutamate--tRNA ligase [Spirochaetes bacterium]|nr:glutamate--tRNA ligase [Spirochaetota bacterium]
MEVRVRYAPSPTGFQHIGGVRTALFNYLFARANGGAFILRLEDTDRTRYADEYVQNLYDTFDWLGFKWDEGPDIGGKCAPYVQSQRFELYREHAEKLVAMGKAYYCFCDEDRLERIRKIQTVNKMAPGYDRHCRSLAPDEIKANLDAGKSFVIRLKIPLEGATAFHDLLLGDIEWKNEDVSPDPVLLKSDGFPTYHLANVVDDHFMRVTHVLRAQEWIPSTPMHVVMYEAFGWMHPEYCHLPMVMGSDGHKLSKRHGATSMNEFRNGGYLKEAVINYIGMLGASYEEGKDLFSLAEMEMLFRVDKLNKAPAVFDYKKLEWFNGQYIRLKTDAELYELIVPFLEKDGVVGHAPDGATKALLFGVMPLIKERLRYLTEVSGMVRFFFEEPAVPPLADLVPKKLDVSKTRAILARASELLESADLSNHESTEAAFRAAADELGVKLGDMLMPVRMAVTGTRVSPPLFESIRILGVEKARSRIGSAIAAF